MKKNPWRKLSSKTVYKNPWYSVRQDMVIRPDGKNGEYNVVVTHPGVYIVALNTKKEIYLVGLHRYTTNMYSLEVPAGSSDGQKPLVAAKRELREEAGLKAAQWKQIGTFQTANGFAEEMGYVFLAQELIEISQNEQLEEGIQEVVKVPFNKALKMVETGEITDGQTIVAITLAKSYIK